MGKHDTCQKCGQLCITKDGPILGPLEGRYEWLCKSCAIQEETTSWPLKWKKNDPR